MRPTGRCSAPASPAAPTGAQALGGRGDSGPRENQLCRQASPSTPWLEEEQPGVFWEGPLSLQVPCCMPPPPQSPFWLSVPLEPGPQGKWFSLSLLLVCPQPFLAGALGHSGFCLSDICHSGPQWPAPGPGALGVPVSSLSAFCSLSCPSLSDPGPASLLPILQTGMWRPSA